MRRHDGSSAIPLTVVVLARNEERMIGDCLASVSFADQKIVIDGKSTDATVKIAEKLGAVVYIRADKDFSVLRNFALDQATHDFVLMLDADERVTPDLREEIQKTVPNPKYAAYRIERINISFGKSLRNFGRDFQVKLLRRDLCRYEGRVHEKISAAGAIGQLSGAMLHFPYESWAEYWVKFRRYAQLDYVTPKEISNPILRAARLFYHSYIVNRGFLDGIVGLTLCLSSAFYELIRPRKALPSIE